MSLNIEIPKLEHKYIRLYNTEAEYEADKDTYEEVCYSIIKSIEATEDNYNEYQYSTRTTNNDNQVKGKYWNMEVPNMYGGLEIIWGYFGWEWHDFEWNGEILKGGDFYQVKPMTEVKSIPDGNRLQHINNFLKNIIQNVTTIHEFDTSNIKSAEYAFYNNDNNNFPNINIDFDFKLPLLENAKFIAHKLNNIPWNNTLECPNLIIANYAFAGNKNIQIKPINAGTKVEQVEGMYQNAILSFLDIGKDKEVKTLTLKDLFWDGIEESCYNYNGCFKYVDLTNTIINLYFSHTEKNISINEIFNYINGDNVTINFDCSENILGFTGSNFVNFQEFITYKNLNVELSDNFIAKNNNNLTGKFTFRGSYKSCPLKKFHNNVIYNNVYFTTILETLDLDFCFEKEDYPNNNSVYNQISINIKNKDNSPISLINYKYTNGIIFSIYFENPIQLITGIDSNKLYNFFVITTNAEKLDDNFYVKCKYRVVVNTTNIDYSKYIHTINIIDSRDYIIEFRIEGSTHTPKVISNVGLPNNTISQSITYLDFENCNTENILSTSIVYKFNSAPNIINIKIGNCCGNYNFYNCKNIDANDFNDFINKQNWKENWLKIYYINIEKVVYDKLNDDTKTKMLELFQTININE